MQNSLIAAGYSLPVYGPDGDFGGETETAVIQFQTNEGIVPPNGIVESATWIRLCEVVNGGTTGGGTTGGAIDTDSFGDTGGDASGGGSALRDPNVNTRLPQNGPGYYTYCPRNPCENPDDRQFGTVLTIDSITEIARNWNLANPDGPRIGIGDISLRGGGSFRNTDGTLAHAEHKEGKDIDIRPLRIDGGEMPTDIKSSTYDREQTRELINTIRENTNVVRILFNDPVLIGEGIAKKAAGHDNHIHIDFRD
jgi:peptidoglycan hydrolase-like protein with peptidoglycan-binding domain